jgi:two-component sensor histidine kinase
MKHHYLNSLQLIICLVISLTITAQTSQYHLKKVLLDQGPGTNKINDIAQDEYGFLWIATSDGLNRFDGTGLVKFYHQENTNSISHNYVYCLKMLPGNVLAIGTHGGLSFYDGLTGKFTNFYYKLNNALDEYNNAIIGIDTDSEQRCWAYSSNCIFIFDSTLLLEKIISSPAPKAGIMKKNFRLFEKMFSIPPQKTMITAINVNGKYSSDVISPIILRSKKNDITIHYTNIDLPNGASTNYAYQLLNRNASNADTSWIETGHLRQINFSGLSPGDYLFRVCSSVNNKPQVEKAAGLSFSIPTHFTQTSWFYVLLIPAIAIVFYCMYRYHITQLKRTEQIRSEISRNLHDEVGSTLTNISLGSLLAQKQLAKDSPVIRILDRIYQDSQNVSQTMREIVWSINPRVDTLSEALPRMLHYASELLEARNIELEAEIGPGIEHVKLSMYKRKDFYLIFKEAVNNLSKHSNADHVKFSIQMIRRTLTMRISDNGKGFDPAFDSESNGLKNMRERARAHHWQLAVQSVPGNGTTIGLKFQIA